MINNDIWINIQWFNSIYLILLLTLSLLPYNSAQSDKGNSWIPELHIDNQTELVAFVCGIILMVVYCILFIWRTNFLNEQRRIRGHLNDSVTTATSTSKGGLDLKVIETIPVFVYSDIKNRKKIDTNETVVECAVCLGEYEDEDMLRLLPICRHIFHCHCIDAWFISHSTCPVCRSNIEVMPPEAALNAGGSAIDVFEDGGNHSESTMTVINVTAEQTHVSVSVAESSEQATDNVNLNKEMNPNQTTGRSVNPFGRLSRSHSTGHSLVPENTDRYTLGSPDDVRKASVNGKLNRFKRCVTFTV
ncbi:hypothetical protein MKW98_028777 [Papaver atlanticum]|uniref:RING-type E3 ubiquitin transferase n=1 Tax=Papaver atlanticum TaxID=357466 RepID=A0AAD4XAU8_9MAGN|nr:hypothetical protein MKW98_028777 [Papaver atlanticum]